MFDKNYVIFLKLLSQNFKRFALLWILYFGGEGRGGVGRGGVGGGGHIVLIYLFVVMIKEVNMMNGSGQLSFFISSAFCF